MAFAGIIAIFIIFIFTGFVLGYALGYEDGREDKISGRFGP
jgi:hypothetical protein